MKGEYIRLDTRNSTPDYIVRCGRPDCQSAGIITVLYARHVPKKLRSLGWRTLAGRWFCPGCSMPDEGRGGNTDAANE